jgi:hypothetical protein
MGVKEFYCTSCARPVQPSKDVLDMMLDGCAITIYCDECEPVELASNANFEDAE